MGRGGHPRFGGQKAIRLFAKGNHELTDSVLSTREGGRKLSRGLADRVRDCHEGAYDLQLDHEGGAGSAVLAEQLAGMGADPPPAGTGVPRTGIWQARPDVVLLSLQPETEADADEFLRNMLQSIKVLKHEVGAHVIVANASTIDPADHTSNYHRTGETLSLRIHRLNLAVMSLSVSEGISIVDVDRLIADLGAGQHVAAALDYSAEACAAICDELVRVLAEYGFFEPRPLIAQIGRGEA